MEKIKDGSHLNMHIVKVLKIAKMEKLLNFLGAFSDTFLRAEMHIYSDQTTVYKTLILL